MANNGFFQNRSRGILLVLSGPSGSGKGTVLKKLATKNCNIKYSISATTRKPRINEVEGRNYFFKTKEEFEVMIKGNELIEWVEYCENYYGTPLNYVNDNIEKGYDVILEIEVEGATNIKEKYPNCVSVFISPPSFEELRRRLLSRATENNEVISKRLKRAEEEMSYINKYDYVIINSIVENAADELNCILKAEKLKNSRQ